MKIISLTILILFMCASEGIAGTVIRLVPSAEATVENSPLTLSVYADNVSGLRAASVTITFDDSYVVYNSAAQSSFLPNAIQLITPPTPSNPDRIIVDQAILGSGSVSGSGMLFTLTFTPKKGGAAPFTVSSATLLTISGDALPYTVQNTTIVIPAFIRCTAFLQGPFNASTGQMDHLLNDRSMLPLSHPYSLAPWKYDGVESATRPFFLAHTSIVDWILVELRQTPTSVRLAARAGFLLQDGRITDIDGESPLRFEVDAGRYFLVVRHRNHLAIMSAHPVTIDNISTPVNFTVNQAAAFGSEPMAPLAEGVYGMPGGDFDADGHITGSDFNLFLPAFKALQTGYAMMDFNMDGMITGSDFNGFNFNFIGNCYTAVP